MDNAMIKKLTRQMRIINLWLGFYGILMIAILGTLGFVLYKFITFSNQVTGTIQDVKQTVSSSTDKLCKAENLFGLSSSCKK